ncbi:Na+/H+ antiporter subunit D [Pseudoxanthobacter sp.]|uniref:Na+/H+ antiporter subunit D n=1 Tax=Pseudoxanthobacter sp. TaxID=1925742 RepID=UPI002FE3B92B
MAADMGKAAVDVAAALNLAPVSPRDMLVIVPVVGPLMAAALAVMLRGWPRSQPAIAIVTLAAMIAAEIALLARTLGEGPVTMVMGRWQAPFGIAFTVDTLGAVLALTAAVAGLAGAVYARADIDGPARRAGFYPFLLAMMAGVSGAFLTGDIFNLYVWFEVLLISSFGLLVLGGEPRQLDGTVKYGLLNLIATTLFLVTTGYLYGLVGTLNMADIPARLAALPQTAPVMVIASLYLVAFGMKAAAFPVNAWLPASYHTPKIVVGAVFAGLLTKVGAYALIRTLVMLMPAAGAVLSPVIAWVAALTMITGALIALAQNEMRRTMGFLVISGIGYILAGLAIGTADGLAGALAYAVHSMLAMTAIYLAVGAVERIAGSSALTRTGGLYRASPLLAAIFLGLVLAVAGLPPLSGFWPKAMLVRAGLEAGDGWLVTAMLVAGFLITLALGRVWLLAFWRPAPGGGEEVRTRLPATVMLPLAALTLLTLLLGLMPEPLVAAAQAAADGLTDPAAYVRSVFPGAL